MSALTAASAGQAAAEAQMTDTLRIERDGALTTDPATGEVTTNPTVLYQGIGRVRPETSSEADTQTAGEATDLLDQFRVAVPLSVTEVRTNDTVTVVASADPSLVGGRLRVIGVVRGTAVTARRLRCRLDSVS